MNQQINKMEEFLQKRFDERDREKEKENILYSNQKEIQEGLEIKVTDFYCKKCKCDYEDYRTTAITETDWTQPGKYIAYWQSKHRKCGQINRRWITDKQYDPYWFKSPKMKRDVGNYYRDMLQPHETGFEMLYQHKFNQQ